MDRVVVLWGSTHQWSRFSQFHNEDPYQAAFVQGDEKAQIFSGRADCYELEDS